MNTRTLWLGGSCWLLTHAHSRLLTLIPLLLELHASIWMEEYSVQTHTPNHHGALCVHVWSVCVIMLVCLFVPRYGGCSERDPASKHWIKGESGSDLIHVLPIASVRLFKDRWKIESHFLLFFSWSKRTHWNTRIAFARTIDSFVRDCRDAEAAVCDSWGETDLKSLSEIFFLAYIDWTEEEGELIAQKLTIISIFEWLFPRAVLFRMLHWNAILFSRSFSFAVSRGHRNDSSILAPSG